VGRTLVRLSMAGLVAAAATYVASHAMTDALGIGLAGSLAGIAAGLAVGVPVYIGLVLRMRIPEVLEVRELARGSVGGSMGPAASSWR
jgi:hypothetical protein